MEAAETVCAGDEIESADVLDLLSHLVNKNLVIAGRPERGERHYCLLETIREYALEKSSDCVYPCPCGYYGDSQKPCTCAHALVTKYQKRISGPLLDRIDIHIEVPRVDYEKLSGDRLGESSASIRARVQAARDIQRVRFTTPESRTSAIVSSDIICNADMRVGEIRQFCRLQACPEQGRRDEGQRLMRAATLCCA